MAAMRISGLASGMDIDGMVEKLMVAQRMPMDKLEQQKQTYEWQRDAYREVNKKLTTFDTYVADNFILKSLNTKTATSSNADLVGVKATSAAVGSLSIESVSQLATAARGIGDKQERAEGSTKLSTLGITGNSISLKSIQANGELAEKATKIEIDSTMTINEFVSKINGSDAGVSAIFENGRLSITATNTGDNKSGAEVQVTAGADVFGKLGFTSLLGKTSGDLATGGTNALFEVNGIATERSTNNFTLNGFNVTLNKTFNEDKAHNRVLEEETQKRDAALNTLNTTLNSLQTKYPDVSSSGDLNTQVQALETKLEAEIGSQQTIKTNASTDLDAKRAVSLGDSTAGAWFDNLSAENKQLLLDTSDLATLTPEQQALFGGNASAVKDVLLAKTTFDDESSKLANLDAAKANLVGQKQTYDAAKSSVDELSTAAPTPSATAAPVTMTATTNVDEMVDRIKDFVNTYNGLIKDLNSKRTEEVYRDFKPLTALQKKAMEENEIKLWEEKAKSGMLRGDSIIQSGLSALRELQYHKDPSIINPKYNSVQNIGISSSRDWTLGGALEINEAELREALQEDPDAVVKLLTNDGEGSSKGFMRKVREEIDIIEKNIDNQAGRGTMTEAQYALGKNLQDVNRRLTEWQTKLQSIEGRYWQQFGAMEAMINKANSQSAMLMSQFYS